MPQAESKRKQEEFTAAASVDRTPRVAIIPSDFKGSEEHDGSKIEGLADPQPVRSRMSAERTEAWVSSALAQVGKRANTQPRLFGPDEWVLVLGDGGGSPVFVTAVVAVLARHKQGLRFTVAAGALEVDSLRKRFPGARFDTVDLEKEAVVQMPAPRDVSKVLGVPRVLQQCDKVVSVARIGRGGGEAMGAYRRASKGAAEWLDLARFHPPDLAVASALVPNLIVAGTNALSVDAVTAAIRGQSPAWLREAEKLGLGVTDPDAIWTRGIEIDDAKKLLAAG